MRKSSDADTFLIAVAMAGPDVIRSAIDSGINVNEVGQKGVPPIVLATVKGREDILDLLLHANADVNQADRNGGMMALHAAATQGNVGLVQKLIDWGADLDTSFGDPPTTALAIAFRNGFNDVLACLLEAGANPNVSIEVASDPPEQRGITPLIYASSVGDVDRLRLLISHNADVNAPKADGLTPLMVAAFRGRTQAVKMLVEAGAEIHTTLPVGPGKAMTASDLAAAKGHREIVNYLASRARKPGT